MTSAELMVQNLPDENKKAKRSRLANVCISLVSSLVIILSVLDMIFGILPF